MKTCRNCILPENYKGGISFDEKGICLECRDYSEGEGLYGKKNESRILSLRDDFERAMEDAKKSGSVHECVVSLSGGKDSAYLADIVLDKKKYGMNPLLISVDTGFLSPLAHRNIPAIVDNLEKRHGKEIKHIWIKDVGLEKTMKKIYRHLFSNPGEGGYVRSICYVCAPLMEDIAASVAADKGIPLLLAGYSPGQPEEDFMFYEVERDRMKESHVPDWMTAENGFSDRDRKWFWDPEEHGEGVPRILAPFHVTGYNQDDVISSVVESGIIPDKRRTDPAETNCLLNWPMMLLDIRRLGHNPYIGEFSRQVREGRADRRAWKRKFWLFDNGLRLGLYKRKEIDHVSESLGMDIRSLE